MYTASTDVIKERALQLRLRIMRSSPTMAKIAAVLSSNCNVPLLPLFLKAVLSAANSAKCKVCAERINGTWAGVGTWQPSYGASLRTGRSAQELHPTLLPHSDSDPITPENTNEPYGESPVSPAIGAYLTRKPIPTLPCVKNIPIKDIWVNIRLIRYADVLLMGAESANEKGISGEAIDYLEQVRARARGTNSNILPKVTTTDQGELREAIRHERRVELGLEFDRFYDLVRWGIAKEVLHAAGNQLSGQKRTASTAAIASELK